MLPDHHRDISKLASLRWAAKHVSGAQTGPVLDKVARESGLPRLLKPVGELAVAEVHHHDGEGAGRATLSSGP